MTVPKHVWDQLRATTADELVKALLRHNWAFDSNSGAVHVYRRPDGRRVAIHYHPRKSYGPGLLKALLEDIGWTEQDLRRLKLIK